MTRTEPAYENNEVTAAERKTLAKTARYREPEPVGETII